MATLLSVLEAGQAKDPAIIVPDGPRFTYGDLRTQVVRTADALAALGLERSDRIAMAARGCGSRALRRGMPDAPRALRTRRTSHWFSTRAARPAARSASRSGTATWRLP